LHRDAVLKILRASMLLLSRNSDQGSWLNDWKSELQKLGF